MLIMSIRVPFNPQLHLGYQLFYYHSPGVVDKNNQGQPMISNDVPLNNQPSHFQRGKT